MSTNVPARTGRALPPLMRPFQTLRDEIEQAVSRIAPDWGGKWPLAEFSPACDLSETSDAYQVRMDVPGIKPEEIAVQVTGDSVRISGERKEEKEEKDKTFHRIERRNGSFCEVLQLPGGINEEKVQAEFHDGVLTITLPKSESARTRTVKVKSGVNR